ncbi:glycoside hydrolase superfamily [Aspergillus californicus]
MLSKTQLLAFALSLASAQAASKGFNYGATKPDGTVKVESDFRTEFQTAKNLETTSGFNSARLYTMIQGSGSEPISAIPAAIAEKTTLLLGLWASGGNMDNEIAALSAAIEQYGEDFTELVVGISVGSEDLYRSSETGVQANAGVGIEADELVGYINKVRSTIAGTSLSGAAIGHVDTWNSWTNGSNSAVVEAVDWLGFDGYPFYENTKPNSIDDAAGLFQNGVAKTKEIANGKEVWITETGWPVSGSTQNLAVASPENAKQFWDEVGCPLFDDVNTWWYILQDGEGSNVPADSFGIVGTTLSTTPLFDLSCPAASSTASASASASATGSATKSSSSPSVTGGSGSGSGSSLGSSDSWGHGQFGASSLTISPSGSPTPSSSAIGSSSSGSSSSSSSSSDSSSDSTSGTGTSSSGDESSSSTSADSADFTGAGNRLTGSMMGAAMLVAALAIAL